MFTAPGHRLISAAPTDEDGCIAFWAVEDLDKPLCVRTVETNDVNVTDAESVRRIQSQAACTTDLHLAPSLQLFDSGALDRDPDAPPGQSGLRPRREPIFKLSWASFPDAASLAALEATGEVVSDETKAFAIRDETVRSISPEPF
jgi:syntaxin-binding protein 5